jgi:TolB protein
MRLLSLVYLLSASAFAQTGTLGAFTNSGDIGGPAIKGSAEFDSGKGEYRIRGAGANMWAKQDQFQYVWREMSGDFAVTATLRFLGAGNAHRKAGIVVRQSPDTDAAYADLVIHGDGMPSLQWRSKQGEDTNTFNLPFDGPGTFKVRLVRTGARIFMHVGKGSAPLKEIGHTQISFRGAVLVGLGVCSHNAESSDTVVFSDVTVGAQSSPPVAQ